MTRVPLIFQILLEIFFFLVDLQDACACAEEISLFHTSKTFGSIHSLSNIMRPDINGPCHIFSTARMTELDNTFIYMGHVHDLR